MRRLGRALAGFRRPARFPGPTARCRAETAKLVAGGILAGGSTFALCDTVTHTQTTTVDDDDKHIVTLSTETTITTDDSSPETPALLDIVETTSITYPDGTVQSFSRRLAGGTMLTHAEPPALPAPDDYPPYGIAESVRDKDDYIVVGCGDRRYFCPEKNAVFAADGYAPKALPDLSDHNSHMANFFKREPELYEKLRERKTRNGVSLADCIKTGVDNPGNPRITSVGVVAGDEESYEVFKELFDPVIDACHGGYGPKAVQPTNLDLSKLSNTDIDPDMKYVLTTRVRTARSVRGFRLPSTIGFQERRDLEALVVKALLNMEGDLKGDYFPLSGSRSYAPMPEGMSTEKGEMLRKCGNLFDAPDDTVMLASGMARHWPDARGVFHNDAQNLFVWVNEEDHLRIVSMQGSREKPTPEGKQIKEVTTRFINACNEVDNVLKKEGSTFMHNNHHGYILACPSNVGTGLRAGTMVKLPKLSAKPEWKKLLQAMKLGARGGGGTWDVSNAECLGEGEVDLVNTVIEGAAQLVKWEKLLDAGKTPQVDAEIKTVIEAFRIYGDIR